MDELKIAKSKSKLVPLGIGAVFFLVLGVTMLSSPDQFVGRLWNSLNLIRVLGGLSLVFFWITLFFIVRRLTDQTPGLILDKQGFISDSGFVQNIDKFAGEHIPWQDIRKIREFKSDRDRFVEIEFINEGARTSFPENDNNTRSLSQIASGPPFLLSSKDLHIEFDILLAHLNHYHQAYLGRSEPKH